MVQKAATETNPRKRIARYRQLQRYLLDQMPMVTLYHTPILIGAAKNLQGFSPGSTGLYEYGTANWLTSRPWAAGRAGRPRRRRPARVR